jgi:hypothetical protein
MKKQLIILIFICLVFNSYAQNISFTEITNIPFPKLLNSSIAFADIDNDNDEDLLISGNDGSTNITCLFKNNGKGDFTEVHNSVLANYYGKIAFGDIDGDNDLDVIIGKNLFVNDGLGNFSEKNAPFISNGPIGFGDFDNDNDLDVILDRYFYKNDGLGNFTNCPDSSLLGFHITIPYIGFLSYNFESIDVADIDNDNDLDFMVIGRIESDIHAPMALLFVNDGHGNFAKNAGFDGVSSGAVKFFDIDNDGDKDLLLTGADRLPGGTGTDHLSLYRNDGAGNFTIISPTNMQSFYWCAVAFADVDNDGDLDLFMTGTSYYNSIYYAKMYSNNGEGSFSYVSGMPFVPFIFCSAAFSDIDNDGDMDLLVSGNNHAESNIPDTKLYKNNFQELDTYSEYKIFPNPTEGIITIATRLFDNIEIFDLKGICVYKSDYQKQIDLGFLADGDYIIKITQKDLHYYSKLVVIH